MIKSFSMLEFVFVIIIIGILTAVAIPRLTATRTDAQITKIRTDISTIRSSISNLRTSNLMKGINDYPSQLDDAKTNKEGEELFDGNKSIGKLLDYPIYSSLNEGHWMKTGDTNYTVKLMDNDIKFNYYSNNGHFDCKNLNTNKSDEICKKLTH